MHIAHHGVSYKIEYHGNIEKEFGRVPDGFESCQKRGQKSRDTLPLEMESNINILAHCILRVGWMDFFGKMGTQQVVQNCFRNPNPKNYTFYCCLLTFRRPHQILVFNLKISLKNVFLLNVC